MSKDLENKLAAKAGQAVQEKKDKTIFDVIEERKEQFAQAVGNRMDVNKFLRIAMFTIRTNQTLMKCTASSLLSTLMQSAQLGLEPGVLGHCYLVPFKNNKTNEYDATFIISYKGMIELARRSGNIESISARIVYENDHFEYEYGLEEKLEHRPGRGNRGAITDVYMVAKFVGGGHYFEVMSKEEVDEIKESSKAYQNAKKYNKTNIWDEHYEEMAKKTVIRRAWKYLPISVDDTRVIEQEGTVKHEISTDMSTVPWIDAEAYVIEEQVVTQNETDSGGEPKPESNEGHLQSDRIGECRE